MKLSFLQSVVVAGLLGCCSGAPTEGASDLLSSSAVLKTARLPIRSTVVAKEVIGQVEYAYDSTGWKTLSPGKTLHAGAIIRASSGSTALLRVTQSASFFKVSPSTRVHLANETPIDELNTVSFAALKARSRSTLAAD